MCEEELCHAAVIVVRAADDFRHGTIAMIEITRQARVSVQMWRRGPLFVIPPRITVGLFQPLATPRLCALSAS